MANALVPANSRVQEQLAEILRPASPTGRSGWRTCLLCPPITMIGSLGGRANESAESARLAPPGQLGQVRPARERARACLSAGLAFIVAVRVFSIGVQGRQMSLPTPSGCEQLALASQRHL